MGILLKTLFISVTLFMLFASSHEVILPKETFKHLVTSFAGGAKATPAWKHFYKSIHGKEARPMFRKLTEMWGIEKPSTMTVFYSDTKELVKNIHEPVTIFTGLSIVKFYEALYGNKEFWSNLNGNYDKETIIRALEIEISILLAEQAERDVCYICTNKHGNAYCGGSTTVFGKYEVPNLSEKVESVYAVVLDEMRDGMYDPSKDNSFDNLKNDLSQHSHGGITLHVIYVTGVDTKQQQLKIVERILKAIKISRSKPSLFPKDEVITVTGEDYMDIFKLE